MQQIFYDQAPYHILYYDSELHAYRTDKFGGWMNQPPDGGTPLFGYGPIGYTLLTLAHGGVAIAVGRGIGARRAERRGGDAGAVRRRGVAATAASSSSTGPARSSGSSLVVLVASAVVVLDRGDGGPTAEEE